MLRTRSSSSSTTNHHQSSPFTRASTSPKKVISALDSPSPSTSTSTSGSASISTKSSALEASASISRSRRHSRKGGPDSDSSSTMSHHRRGSPSPPSAPHHLEPDTPAAHYSGRIHHGDPMAEKVLQPVGEGDIRELLSHNPYHSSSANGDIESMYPQDSDEKHAAGGAGANGGGVGGAGHSAASSAYSTPQLGFSARRGAKMKLNLGSGSDRDEDEKGRPRSGRRGMSRRTWLIIGVIAGFFLLSRRLLPSEPHTIPHPLDTHVLIPRDYLNESRTNPAPFDFCPVFGPGDAIAARRGQFELLRSRVHMGTGARVQKVIQKAMTGAPITFSVLGGSGDDPIHEKCYPSKFFNWWNTIFPHPANELTNGATKKTDSAYYAYCNAHHLPDSTDLVILEFDAADPNDPEWARHFELLVRSALVRPEMPAVIILGHFSPQVQAQHGFAGPELHHSLVAQFYDVPHVSVKGLMYEEYLQRPEQARSFFYPDAVHANGEGHDLIADVLISYMMSQICSGWSAIQGRSFDAASFATEPDEHVNNAPSLLGGMGLRKGVPGQEPGDGDSSANSLSEKYSIMRVPNARLLDRPHDVVTFREIEPYCVSASDLINPLPNSLFFGSGWHTYHPAKNAIAEDRHYWYAEQPTARLRIPIRLGAGDVGIYFLQAPPEKPLGSVKCWVDDNYGGAKELHGTAEVQEVMATLVMIDRKVPKGSHYVECQLQGEAGGTSAPFKILGIELTCMSVEVMA